jgi:hypothetical protein
MDDFAACAGLCEEYGFPRQAALLRAVAQGAMRAFAVCERLVRDDWLLADEGGVPVALFLDREDAERDARRRDVLAFRTLNLYAYCEGDISFITDRTLAELEREVSAILGTGYELPDPDTHKGPLFPADATDEQIRAVSRLFDVQFFYVAELEFGDGANPPASAESPS